MAQSLKAFLGTQIGVTDSASDILTKIKTVDGAGSGLDADVVDGQSLGTLAFQDANNVTTNIVSSGDITAGDITANNFIGDGSQLTNAGISTGKAIAMAIVFGG